MENYGHICGKKLTDYSALISFCMIFFCFILQVTISTTDRRSIQLVFKAIVIEMDGNVMIDFRLSKGCGLEFKRRFVKIKYALSDIIGKELTW